MMGRGSGTTAACVSTKVVFIADNKAGGCLNWAKCGGFVLQSKRRLAYFHNDMT